MILSNCIKINTLWFKEEGAKLTGRIKWNPVFGYIFDALLGYDPLQMGGRLKCLRKHAIGKQTHGC